MSEKTSLIVHCGVHLMCTFVSLYIIVPLGTHMSDFRGHCALFSCGTYIEDDGHFEPNWASSGYCIYTILIGFLSFISSLSQLFLKLRLLYYKRESTFLTAFIDFFLDSLVTLTVLISAIFVTGGLYKWCHCVMQRFSDCSTAASVMVIGVNSTIIPTHFSYHLEIVQIGVWSLLVANALQLTLSTRKVLTHHERENLIAVMASERLRYQRQD